MKRIIYKLAIPLLRLYWFVFRPSTFGVKCIIYNNDKVLMIKNTYGKGWWNFPGGSIKKSESEEQAVKREVFEELGIKIINLKLVGKFVSTVEYKRDNITLFNAEAEDTILKLQESEIQEANWVSVDNLPSPMVRVAKRALSLSLQ